MTTGQPTMHHPTPSELQARITTRTLPPPPRESVTADGRCCWPDILRYRYAGAVHWCPPRAHDVRFTVEVLDAAAYELLAATGALRDPRHTGFGSTVVDQRKAPGA